MTDININLNIADLAKSKPAKKKRQRNKKTVHNPTSNPGHNPGHNHGHQTLRDILKSLNSDFTVDDGGTTWTAGKLSKALDSSDLNKEVWFEGIPSIGDQSRVFFIDEYGYQQSPAAFIVKRRQKTRKKKSTRKPARKKKTKVKKSTYNAPYVIRGYAHDQGASPKAITRKTLAEAKRAAKLMKETGYTKVSYRKATKPTAKKKTKVKKSTKKTIRKAPGPKIAGTKTVTYRKGSFKIQKAYWSARYPKRIPKRTLKTETLHVGVKLNSPNKGSMYAVWLSKKTGKVTGVEKVYKRTPKK